MNVRMWYSLHKIFLKWIDTVREKGTAFRILLKDTALIWMNLKCYLNDKILSSFKSEQYNYTSGCLWVAHKTPKIFDHFFYHLLEITKLIYR